MPAKQLTTRQGVFAVLGVVVLGWLAFQLTHRNDHVPQEVSAAAGEAPQRASAPRARAEEAPSGDTRPGRDRRWPADRQPGTALTITAHELAKAYHSNELKADGLFKGQVLEVSGRLLRVEKTFGDIVMHIGDRFQSISIYVRPSEVEKVAALDAGQDVVVQGWGAGAMALGTPRLASAVLVSAKRHRSSDDDE